MQFSQIVRLVLRRWWLIILLAIAGAGGAYFVGLRQKPEYQATATLLVTTGRPSPDALTNQDLQTRQQLAITYKELLIKRPVLDAAAGQVGVDPVDLDKQIRIDIIKDTAILKLSATASDPQLAANLVNAIVQACILQERTLLANPYVATQSGLNVIEPAIPPKKPAGMDSKRYALLGAFLGFMLAVGAAFAMELFDSSIRTSSDLTALTRLPTLAVITRLKGSVPADKLVTLHKPDSLAADAYRMIRVQIEFTSTERALRSIVVTSARPFEGKSVTAANLAVALAQTGLRVILIDANLHRPSLHTLFQRPNIYGLTTALQHLGDVRATDYLVPTAEDRLSLMLSGPIPSNPTSLLMPERLRMLNAELQDHADILIFDSPKCLNGVDTSLLLRSCDAALLVVRSRATKAESLLQTHQILQMSRAHILGVVLNHVSGLWGSHTGSSLVSVPGLSPSADAMEEEAHMVSQSLRSQSL
jgi:capsular exopolysaccharide synthesis family protein